jgi:hypothetical protein
VIDTAGTWRIPNPLGSEGILARGERLLQSTIRYGIPDLLGQERTRYAGRKVLVAGSGHSAFNVLVDLAKLQETEPATTITWIVRRQHAGKLFGGGDNDELVARGALGSTVRRLVDSRRVSLPFGFHANAVVRGANGMVVSSGEKVAGPVDEIIVATGFRPDFSYLRELRLGLDPVVESTPALAPMIDPNLHSCGTVRPHGHRELAHPETGFYIAGMKSYGRAPTFLLRTGYEQVRSIAAALAGDISAADHVELILPATGVCSLGRDGTSEASCCATGKEPSVRHAGVESGAGFRVQSAVPGDTPAVEGSECCGGKPLSNESACCRKDEAAKAEGKSGCGCGTETAKIHQPLVATAER